jgi:DNA invertase Pin-like site-specific DNA recombinase
VVAQACCNRDSVLTGYDGWVSLPSEVLQHLGLASGDQLKVELTDHLKAAGCSVIRAEKASGTRRGGRSELQVLLDFVEPGDTLVVTRIDRLARSLPRSKRPLYLRQPTHVHRRNQ